MKKLNTHTLIMTSMLGCIAALLMYLEVALPIAPSFMKIDLSDIPVVLGALLYGPIYGILTALVKIVLKLLINPTKTMFVGELVNFLLSVSFSMIVGYIYRKKETKKLLFLGLSFSSIITSIFAVLLNWFLTFPLYASIFKLSMNTIIQMFEALNPFVHNAFTMLLFGLLPFNLIKYFLLTVIIVLIYEKIILLIKRYQV